MHLVTRRHSNLGLSKNKPGVGDHRLMHTPIFSYPKTKLLEVFAVRQLSSLLPTSDFGVVINCVNPGLCYSELARNVGTLPKMGMVVIQQLLARTAEEGSRNIVQAAFAGPTSHGAYCSECQVKEYEFPAFLSLSCSQFYLPFIILTYS